MLWEEEILPRGQNSDSASMNTFNLLYYIFIKLHNTRARPIYQFANIIGWCCPVADKLILMYMFFDIHESWMKMIGDLKWFNYKVCLAESGPLFNK